MLPHPFPTANLRKMAIMVVLWPVGICVLYYCSLCTLCLSHKWKCGKREQLPVNWVHRYCFRLQAYAWGRILGWNPDKSLKSVPPCYSQSPLCFAWYFYFFKLTQPLTVSVKEKAGKPDRKLWSLPYGLRNQYSNLKSENSQDYIRKLQENDMFMNSV